MNLDSFTKYVIIFIIGFLAGLIIAAKYAKIYSTPIEKNDTIDSIIAVNDSIKIKIEKLDSIKDAKVIEVSTLNNDSTLKLFYELVSE